MELFIRIKGGQPFEHPILGNNFRQAFPDIDVNNLPPEFARFERVPLPSLIYATLNAPEPTYEFVDGVVKDVWDITPFTPEQIQEKQNQVKAYWAEHGFASWVFNEETCTFDPPTPMPTDGQMYRWNEDTTSWELINEQS
jgi:hypothetical protein